MAVQKKGRKYTRVGYIKGQKERRVEGEQLNTTNIKNQLHREKMHKKKKKQNKQKNKARKHKSIKLTIWEIYTWK